MLFCLNLPLPPVFLGTALELLKRLQVRTANGPRWDMGEFTSPPIRTSVTGSNCAARLKTELASVRLRSWFLLESWRPDPAPALLTTDTCTRSKRRSGRPWEWWRTTSWPMCTLRRNTPRLCSIRTAPRTPCSWTTGRTWSRRSWPATTLTSSACRRSTKVVRACCNSHLCWR